MPQGNHRRHDQREDPKHPAPLQQHGAQRKRRERRQRRAGGIAPHGCRDDPHEQHYPSDRQIHPGDRAEGGGNSLAPSKAEKHGIHMAHDRRQRQKLRRYRPPEMSANAKAAYSTTVPTRWRFHAAGTIPSSRMRRTIATTCATILYLPIVSADRTMPCEAAMARTPVTATSRAMIRIATTAATR